MPLAQGRVAQPRFRIDQSMGSLFEGPFSGRQSHEKCSQLFSGLPRGNTNAEDTETRLGGSEAGTAACQTSSCIQMGKQHKQTALHGLIL
jgi:hypothetical protein